MTHHTEAERALSSLRHLYQQMAGGAVKDSTQAKRIAEGLLSPAIEKLEQAARRAQAAPVTQGLREAAQAVVERWDTPLWKDVPATTVYIADLRAALAAAPQPPEAAPSSVSNGRWPDAPPQENIRGGAPYSDPEFEKLAREHAVWGTAQSALCAQFWLAALAQRVPLSDRKIRQIDAHSGLDAIEFARAIERAHGIKEQST